MQSVENLDVVDVAETAAVAEAAAVEPVAADESGSAVASLSAEQLLARLCEAFPLCFSARGECRPLKIGILDALVAATAGWPGVSKTRLRDVLRRYTNTTRYLQGVAGARQRVGLDGEDAGEVVADHVSHAQQQLEERRARFQAQRKAAARAERQPQEGDAPAVDGAERGGDNRRPQGERRAPTEGRSAGSRPPRRDAGRARGEGFVARSPRPQAERSNREQPAHEERPVRDAQPEMDMAVSQANLRTNLRVKVQTGAKPVYGTVLANQGDNVQVGLDNGLSVWVKVDALRIATPKS